MDNRVTTHFWPAILIMIAVLSIQACALRTTDLLKYIDKASYDLMIVKEDCQRVWLAVGKRPLASVSPRDLDMILIKGVLKVSDRGIHGGFKGLYRGQQWIMAVKTQKTQSLYTLYHRPKTAVGPILTKWRQVKQWNIARGKALPKDAKCEPGRDYFIVITADGTHQLYACTWKSRRREVRQWVLIGECLHLQQTRQIREPFTLKGAHAVPFKLFSVLTPGTIRVQVSWTGASETLRVVLSGRRRPHLADPTAPYAEASGTSPIALIYDATEDDLTRGVGWRLAVYDDHGSGDAQGTIQITIPFDPEMDASFQAQKISLRSGEHWPSGALQTQFNNVLALTPTEGLHAMISLTRALSCEEDRIFKKQGLDRQTFMPGRHAFGFIRKGADLGHPMIAAPLLGITPLEPEDKVAPHILLGNYSRYMARPDREPAYNYVLNDDGTLALSVLFARDTTPEHMVALLGAHTSDSEAISDFLWRVTLVPAGIIALAADDQVEWIEAAPAPTLPENDNTRAFTQVDAVQNAAINAAAGTIAYAGRSGAGITVGADENGGVDGGHNDLNVVADAAGTGAHGTHVAGMIAASGVQSNQNDNLGNVNNGALFQWRGMAPQAAIVDSTNLISTASLLDAIQNDSLDAGNHSHTVDVDGEYSVTAQLIDREIRGGAVSGGTSLPRRPQIYSAGNGGARAQRGDQRGYFAITKQIKNGIICGNWDARPAENHLSPGSSMGPMHDGRVKPDLVAPGTEIISTATNRNEEQAVWYDNGVFPTMGNFTLSFGGQVTANIAFNANAATVRTRLEALPNIAPGDVIVTGGQLPNFPIRVEFAGVFANTDVPDMIPADVGLDAGVDTRVWNLGNGSALNGYVDMGGTSMSSAAVSGITALLLEAWQATYSTPMGTTIDDAPPYPSTLRAVLIQTAQDVVDPNVRQDNCEDVDADSNAANGNDGLGNATATAGPDYATGWGQVNAQAAVDLIEDERLVRGVPVPNRIIQDAVSQGGVITYDFVVNQVGPLQVTLAWDDQEGATQNPAVDRKLVNDLDLELVAPDGVTVFYPWQLGHTIEDAAGNPLADNAQPPGTDIQVQVPIVPTATPAVNDDSVPANALAAGGAWVAVQGKDHLNNVEQVLVPNVAADQIGHWTLRVLGFDIAAGAQDYSVVGFPYPDLAELVVSCEDRVGIDAYNQDIDFTWTVANVGQLASGGPGDTFGYQILLSTDIYLGDDVVLVDSAQAPLGPLAPGASIDHDSSVQISQANANTLMGVAPGGPDVTPEELLEQDVFLIIRADSGEDVLEHNEVNIAVVQLARLVDVVLVFDRSGSMDGEVPVSSGARRKIDVLQSSASLFLDLMRLDAGDRLAEVSFSGNMGADSITTDFGPGGALVEIGVGNIEDARDAIEALEPGRKTNIRGALQQALDVITATPAADRRRTIIFFSDGVKTEGGDPAEVAFLQLFDDENIHVYSVGFGTEGGTGYSSIDIDLLQALANVGEPGFFHVTESAVSLDKFFVDAVAGAIRSDIILDPIDDLASGQTHYVDVPVSKQADSVTFILTWDNPAYPLNLTLRSPSGAQIHAANTGNFGGRTTRVRADTYELYQVRFPLTVGASQDHAGIWQMRISNPTATTVRYSASTMGETSLHLNVPPPAPAGGAAVFLPGDEIPLSAAINRTDGYEVAAASATVTANVPLIGLGDLLSAVPLSPADLAAIPREMHGEPLSDRERMLLALRARIGGNLLPRTDLNSFELPPGDTPDTFHGIFNDTSHEGVYRFTTSIEGLADCQIFQREATTSATVSTGVDPEVTVVVVTPDDGDPGTVTVTVTPLSTGGGFVGPGYGSEVMIEAEHLRPTSAVSDMLDGSYVRRFNVIGRGAAALKVSVLGVDIETEKLDTRIPVATDVWPESGDSRRPQNIRIAVSNPAELGRISGVFLNDAGRRIKLDNVQILAKQGTIQAEVPADLPPGKYAICLKSDQGFGLTTPKAAYRIIGPDGALPSKVKRFSRQIDDLLAAGSQAEAMKHLGRIMQHLAALPTGRHLTNAKKQAAAMQVLNLISQRKQPIEHRDIQSIESALIGSKEDAR